MSDNTVTENQQQKDIELDSSDDEVEKGRSQGGSGLSSDDLDLAAEMMIHCSSNQEFKLATSGNKFDKQQERSQGGKQIINDVQFNSSSSPTNHSSNGAAENQSLNQTASQQEIQQPQQGRIQDFLGEGASQAEMTDVQNICQHIIITLFLLIIIKCIVTYSMLCMHGAIYACRCSCSFVILARALLHVHV